MHRVTHLTIEQGVPAARSIAAGLQAVMAPLQPGVAGGTERARHVRRYGDGRFMSYDDEERPSGWSYHPLWSPACLKFHPARF